MAGRFYLKKGIWGLTGMMLVLGHSLTVQATVPSLTQFNSGKPVWIEIIGLIAGFGTTFAALPDCIAMIKRRSTQGMNPRMSAITGTFQILWLIYGLLIQAPAVIFWNAIAIVTNAITVSAYVYFSRQEKQRKPSQSYNE